MTRRQALEIATFLGLLFAIVASALALQQGSVLNSREIAANRARISGDLQQTRVRCVELHRLDEVFESFIEQEITAVAPSRYAARLHVFLQALRGADCHPQPKGHP